MAFADIYVIKKTRSKSFGIKFLDQFVPNRTESSDDYHIPQYSDEPEIVFYEAEKLMDYLEENSTAEQRIYWRNLDEDNKNRHGMIFYTADSYMIFGISRDSFGIDDTINEEECLSQMKDFLDSEEGYITYECPPEDTYSEFIRVVNYDKNNY